MLDIHMQADGDNRCIDWVQEVNDDFLSLGLHKTEPLQLNLTLSAILDMIYNCIMMNFYSM